jgi:GNAT superfamily N-acetyltransferase
MERRAATRVAYARRMEVIAADREDLWCSARDLVLEYAESLHIDLTFQDFQSEIEHLPDQYGGASACFALASDDSVLIGCGGIRRFDDRACEMKRLYVRPSSQGGGIGRLIAQFLIHRARTLDYEAMLLDTLPAMRSAQSLYQSLGFEPIPPYRHNPVPGATFWKLSL